MTISLVPLAVFVIGLLLWLLPTGRGQEVGRVLMLAGAIGFCVAQGGHSLSIH